MLRRMCLSLIALAPTLGAQPPVDSALATYIAGIKAIDNHAHPLLPAQPGVPADTDNDALPLSPLPPFPLPAGLDPSNPRYIAAWKALYGYPYDDASDAHLRALAPLRPHPAEWVLDQVGTEVMLANRVTMGSGLPAPRFRWVPFADPLLFPLNTAREQEATPDTRPLYPRERRLLTRYLGTLHETALPATLDAYLASVVEPMLAQWKQANALAIKFEIAYLRPFDFGNPTRAAAGAVYARYIAGGVPSRAEYKTLEDFLFREIARRAGRKGLVVHIHCTDIAGGFYSVSGSRPLQLESVFNDSTLRGTRFVLLHGGWPAVDETLSMLGKPNVYADISLMDQRVSPFVLAGVFREWLAEWPDKVLYASDAFGDKNEDPVGWPEGAWTAATTARRGLAIALTGMLRDGEITRDRAQEIARMVLRGNAARLYGME